MNPHLFVYGTLVTSHGHPMGHRLRQEALLLSPATIAGRLYRVGWYPGLRPADTSADLVHGELYRLADPAKSLAWLDEYEGLTAGGTSVASSDQYMRVERSVTQADGSTLTTWVYLFQLTLPSSAHISDGIWRG